MSGRTGEGDLSERLSGQESYPESDVGEFPFDEPGVRYCPDEYPDVRETLRLINLVSGVNDMEGWGFLEARRENLSKDDLVFLGSLAERSGGAVDHGLSVVSFDIDLTLALPEDGDESSGGVVPVRALPALQRMGYIVGTCSDREVSGQRALMERLSLEPDFCVPKSMLAHMTGLLPGGVPSSRR